MTVETLSQDVDIKKQVDALMRSSPAYRVLAISEYPGRYDPRVDKRMTAANEGLRNIAESDFELFNDLTSLGVDIVHGSTSWNFDGILEHGLVPSGMMRQLGIVALGRETVSNPHLRKDVHAVTLDSAHETIRYADMRASGDNQEAISLDSYQALIDSAEEVSRLGHDPSTSMFRALYEDAYELRSRIVLGEIDESTPPHPIVYAISSNELTDKPLVATDSFISNEIAVGGSVPVKSIKAVFVPQKYIDQTESEIARHTLDWKVIALERLRLMTGIE